MPLADAIMFTTGHRTWCCACVLARLPWSGRSADLPVSPPSRPRLSVSERLLAAGGPSPSNHASVHTRDSCAGGRRPRVSTGEYTPGFKLHKTRAPKEGRDRRYLEAAGMVPKNHAAALVAHCADLYQRKQLTDFTAICRGCQCPGFARKRHCMASGPLSGCRTIAAGVQPQLDSTPECRDIRHWELPKGCPD